MDNYKAEVLHKIRINYQLFFIVFLAANKVILTYDGP